MLSHYKQLEAAASYHSNFVQLDVDQQMISWCD